MDAIFASLARGVAFDKKKCGAQMDMFSKGKGKSTDPSATAAPAPATQPRFKHHVPPESVTTGGASRTLQEIEALAAFRHRIGIRVEGSDVPPLVPSFAELDFGSSACRDAILSNIEGLEFKEPTPVQMQSIPALIAGRDVLACAPTGSGKTLAYMLPMLIALHRAKRAGTLTGSVAGLVLAPTRELAQQIVREARKYGANLGLKIAMLTKSNAAGAGGGGKAGSDDDDSDDDGSGSDSEPDSHKLCKLPHVDILVATPRLLEHVMKVGARELQHVQMVALDEGDRLLELGFVKQVDSILATFLTDSVQRCLFSATMPQGIGELASSVLRDPVNVTVGTKGAGASTVKQRLVFVGREDGKVLALRQLIAEGINPPVLVFVQSKERAKELYSELAYDGVNIDVIHADRTKSQREEIVRKLRCGELWVLITTDLLARGMDFKGVKLVINYDFPQSMVSYIHRIGRTGRAGKVGEAITLFTEQDIPMLRTLANVMMLSGCDVPRWMLGLKAMSRSRRKQLERIPMKRHRITSVPSFDKKKSAHKRQMVAGTQHRGDKKRPRDDRPPVPGDSDSDE